MNNTSPNPMFAKFDQALGVKTPTPQIGAPKVTSRAEEIRSLGATPRSTGFLQGDTFAKGGIANDIGKSFQNHAQNISNEAKNVNNVFNDPNKSIAEKGLTGLSAAGHVAGNVAGAVGDMFGSVISHVTPQPVKDFAANKVKEVSDNLMNKDSLYSKGINAYANNVPENSDVNKSVGDVVNTASLLGGKEASPIVKDAAGNIINEGKNIASDIKGGVVDPALETAGKIKDKVMPSESVDKTTGKVLQGKPADIESGKSGLSSMDTSKVKTYKDLKDTANKTITEKARIQDENLAKDPTPRPLESFTKTVGEGNGVVKTNYVKQAIDNLGELYTNTSDAEGLSKIKTLEDKATGEGLTVKEVNDLARMYGSEFGTKAFGKTGEALTSVNATKFENIRSGLKNTARDLLPDEASRALDEEMSNIYTVRDLATKMETRVNTLTQRLQKPNILQKLGGMIGRGMRITGIGDLASKLLGIDKVPGAATLNAVELEAQLSKNLGKINAALLKDDAGFVKDMQDLLQSENSPINKNNPSNATNPNANPGDKANSIKNNSSVPITSNGKSFTPKSQTGKVIKSVVDGYKNNPNKQGGYIRIGNKVIKAIPEATKKEMVQAIDYLRIGKSIPHIEDTLSRLANKYGISQDLPNSKIAEKLEAFIENTKTL